MTTRTNKRRREFPEHEAYISLLEPRFAHISKRLRLIWNSPECDRYLNQLLIEREPEGRRCRQGFPAYARRALRTLVEMHPRYPEHATTATSIWENAT